MAHWEVSELGGGGGINCIAGSDDGSCLISVGDISGAWRSLDQGVTWSGAKNGLFDGGESGRAGGVDFKRGSSVDALMALGSGLWLTADAKTACSWTRLSTAMEFGDGGGNRPRINVGHVVACASDYGWAIDLASRIHRYRFSTATFSFNIISADAAAGEAICVDPTDNTILLVGTRSGIYRISSATGSATKSTFTGTNAPNNAYGVIAVVHPVTSDKYLFAAELGQGIKRLQANGDGTWPMTGTWTTMNGSMRAASDWCALDGVQVFDEGSPVGIRLAAGCSVPRRNANGRDENLWICDNPTAGSPSWTCASIDDANVDFRNEMGGAGGPVSWVYLARAAGGNNGQNALAANAPSAVHSTEDVWIDRANPGRIYEAGQNGNWYTDFDAGVLYPSFRNLGVSTHHYIACDPNSSNHIYSAAEDHACFVTEDGGETWRKNENQPGDFAGTTGSFSIAFDEGVTPSRVYMSNGERTVTGLGDVFYHTNPANASDWHRLPFTNIDGVHIGLAVRRMTFNGQTRVVIFTATDGAGMKRAVLSTADPPAIIEDLTDCSPDVDIPSGSQTERADVWFMDDDTVITYVPASGLWLTKEARATTPRFWKIWNIPNDNSRGEAFCCVRNADTAFVSTENSGSRGVYRLTGIQALTHNSGTVEGGQITDTLISKPSGSWRRPGPIAYCLVNGTGRLFVMDGREQDDNGTSGTNPQAYISTDAGGLTLTDITDDAFRGSIARYSSAAQAPDGKIVVCQGPGIVQYVPDEAPPPASITVVDPGADVADSSDLTAYTTPAFTPVSGERIVVFTFSGDGDGADVPVLSNSIGVGSWTQHRYLTTVDLGKGLAMFSGVVGVAANGTITATYPDAQRGGGIHVLRTAGSTGVRNTAEAQDVGNNPLVTLPALNPNGLSCVIGAALQRSSTPGLSPESGDWTESYDAGFDPPTTGIAVTYRSGTTDSSWQMTGATTEWLGVAMELEVATATDGAAALSWAELETPDATGAVQLSWAEMEVPNAPAPPPVVSDPAPVEGPIERSPGTRGRHGRLTWGRRLGGE